MLYSELIVLGYDITIEEYYSITILHYHNTVHLYYITMLYYDITIDCSMMRSQETLISSQYSLCDITTLY
ncbi:hypothetical protein A6R68_05193 [Neotoma lepida]|uniref:Uncharacterized protein n=1 Tax=Neotoma lepida TaxID=56216 RepID=A0A1A6GJ63_NEOLE|nr:hypothetical protein A6R68_05193 [Neotoma lepida]